MYMQDYGQSPMGAQMGAQYQSPASLYAHGGHAGHNMHQEAEHLRQYGVGRDRVLAHINPSEASYLQHHYGMSMNPHTGLPQFGLWDMVKSGAGALGNAALDAAPGLWAQYGQPLMQSALSNIDSRVQQGLPGAAQKVGQYLGGERYGQQLGQLGQSVGQNLAGQYGKYGGLSGQIMPRANQAMGVQGPSQYPQFGGSQSAMNAARNVGAGVWDDRGQQMMQGAMQGADQMIGRGLGSVPGVGSSMQQAYEQTPGVQGYAMPRANQAMNRVRPGANAYAHGGHTYAHNYQRSYY